MGTLVIVYLALLSTFVYVSAEDTSDAEITLKSEHFGTIAYGILDIEGSVLIECFLERVNENVYQLYPESNVTSQDIFYVQLDNFKCGFKITDVNVQYCGKWILKATYLLNDDLLLESKPLNIIIEHEVPMLPETFVTVYQGETLYVRFSENAPNIQACEVLEGSSQRNQSRVSDGTNMVQGTNCSVTFKDVQPDISGLWTFKAHGDLITLWGQMNITVLAVPSTGGAVFLRLGSSATLKIGPKHATYCEATDPTGLVHVSQYGQCSFKLPIATDSHNGYWKVRATIPGKTASDVTIYTVIVAESYLDQINPDKVVTQVTYLSRDESELRIKCSLMVPSINGCRMVRSDGKVWNETTPAEEMWLPYVFSVETTNDLQENIISECTITVNKTEIVDLLPWQCFMSHGEDNREVGTYIEVLEWSHPILADYSNNTDLDYLEKQDTVLQMQGKSFEVKCSLDRKLDYCWFRAPNTKQIVPIPGANNSAYEYVGRGLGLGDCGIRINNATGADTGTWTCNMGSYTDRDLNQKTRVVIYRSGIRESYKFGSPNAVTLTCTTLDESALDYCRFVRPDGLGINPSHTNGSSYDGSETQLSRGRCKLFIPDMAYEDFGTWTCAGKPTNSAEEYQETIYLYRYIYFGSRSSTWFPWTLYFIFTLGMALILVSIVKRTKMAKLLRQRTRHFRQSFRNRGNQNQNENVNENEYKSPKQIEAESQI